MQWGTGEELVFYITSRGEISFETKQYNGAFWAEPHVAVSLSVYLSVTCPRRVSGLKTDLGEIR